MIHKELPPPSPYVLDKERVIDFIIDRFAEGAKCFNGEWWGGCKESVIGSPFGFDIHVWAVDEQYYAKAFGYKDEVYNIDLKNILVDSFLIPFSLIVFVKDGAFSYLIHDIDIDRTIEGLRFENYIDAAKACSLHKRSLDLSLKLKKDEDNG